MNELRSHMANIGVTLSKLGNELQTQAQSNQPLNIHGHVVQTMNYLTYHLHNLNSDLDACRFHLIKEGECHLYPIDIETIKVALHHLLEGASYTHNGETSSPTAELYRLTFLIDSLYRLLTHGSQGSTEYIFDIITEKDR